MNYDIQKDPFIIELKNKARMNHIPLYAGFELTSRCNLNCKMCYIHNSNAKEVRENELSTEQWHHIFNQAIEAGMMFALLTGGECLLREDFEDLYLYLYNKGIRLSINTNAVLIDEKKAAFFGKYKPDRIQISLYGCSEDAYEAVTERRVYDKVIRAFELLERNGIHPAVGITPSKYMNDFPEIFQFVNAHKYKYRINPALFEPRDGHSISECVLTNEELVEIKKQELAILGRELKVHNSSAPEPGCDFSEIEYGIPCNAGTVRAVITYNGMMVPCMSIPEISISVLDNSYSECWNYIWKRMAGVLRPPMCEECYYKKSCVYCPVMRYDGLYSGKCKPYICELMKSKYEAGTI